MRETTSASNLPRRKACPGSANAEENIIDQSSESADEGTLLHPFAENPMLPRDHLSEQHRNLLSRVDQNHKELLGMFFDDTGCESPVNYPKIRLRLQDPEGEPMFSGENDFAMFDPASKTVLIEDYKMGFTQVTHASENTQLACYAVSWGDYLEADSVIVAINQPRSKEPLTVARYSRAQLEQARLELTAIYRASQQPDAPRIAGEEQCRFCKAKLFCEEYRRKFEPLLLKPDAQTIQQIDADSLIRMYEAVRFASRIADPVIEEFSRRVAAGDPDFHAWEMAETGSTRQGVDVIGVYRTLSDFFSGDPKFTPARFTECTKVSLGQLTGLFRELTGMSEARAKKLLSTLLEPHCQWVPKRPTPRLKKLNAESSDCA